MNRRRCCPGRKGWGRPVPTHSQARHAPRPASPWRRGLEVAGWLIPGATLVLLPKCPVCVAMYVALFSGVGISLASASILRMSLLILCLVALLYMAVKCLYRLVSHRKRFHFGRAGV